MPLTHFVGCGKIRIYRIKYIQILTIHSASLTITTIHYSLFTPHEKKKSKMKIHSFYSFSKLDASNVLSSQAVARQVFSPLQVFTTVFGMGTGGLLAIGH